MHAGWFGRVVPEQRMGPGRDWWSHGWGGGGGSPEDSEGGWLNGARRDRDTVSVSYLGVGTEQYCSSCFSGAVNVELTDKCHPSTASLPGSLTRQILFFFTIRYWVRSDLCCEPPRGSIVCDRLKRVSSSVIRVVDRTGGCFGTGRPAENGHNQIVKFLLDNGVPVDSDPGHGRRTALQARRRKRFGAVLQTLYNAWPSGSKISPASLFLTVLISSYKYDRGNPLHFGFTFLDSDCDYTDFTNQQPLSYVDTCLDRSRCRNADSYLRIPFDSRIFHPGYTHALAVLSTVDRSFTSLFGRRSLPVEIIIQLTSLACSSDGTSGITRRVMSII